MLLTFLQTPQYPQEHFTVVLLQGPVESNRNGVCWFRLLTFRHPNLHQTKYIRPAHLPVGFLFLIS